MYENAHIQMVAVDFPKRRKQEPSILRTFVSLNVLNYKRAEQSRRQSGIIQSALC